MVKKDSSLAKYVQMIHFFQLNNPNTVCNKVKLQFRYQIYISRDIRSAEANIRNETKKSKNFRKICFNENSNSHYLNLNF